MTWNKTPKQDLVDEPELVIKAALRYLGRREYTAAELRQRLKERGAAAADIAEALAYAQERGYQNDARAAESHIRQRLNYAPRGRALVRYELRERGLPPELAEAMLETHYPPEAEQELLNRLLAKEQPPVGDAAETRRRWQQMARRLIARGFAQAMVFAALEEWLPPTEFADYVD